MGLAVLPEPAAVGCHRSAFVQHDRSSRSQRPVGDITMSGDPAHIGRAPEHIVGAQIEYPLAGELYPQQIAAAGVLDALGLAGGSGCVQQEERMLRVHPHGIAYRRLPFDDVVPPQIAAGAHLDGLAGAPQDDDAANTGAAASQSFIDSRLELDDISAPPTAVGRDHQHRLGVFDPVLQRRRGETSEHH